MALDHQKTDRPPFQATFTPEFAQRLANFFQINYAHVHHDPHNGRWNGYELEKVTQQDALQAGIGWFTNYYHDTKPYTDEWGVSWKTDKYSTPFGEGIYTNILEAPLGDEKKLNGYAAPDPTRPDLYKNLGRLIKAYQSEYYIIARIHCTIFETAWALRGFEKLMMDFYLNSDLADEILEIAYGYHATVAKKTAEMGADMIWLGDDFGAQDAMLIDPELWRIFFKERMANLISEVKKTKPDIKIAYHTDGNVYDIIPDLIEIGVDVLNPVQTESMDPVLLQRKYGKNLCFFGGIAVQSTLPKGKPSDVIHEFKFLLQTLGKDGGWICSPTHHVQLDTPMENFLALVPSS